MEESQFYTQLNQEKVYILYADLKEYSANKDDLNLIIEMEDVLYEIGIKYFDERQHCFKVMGDGIMATDKYADVLAHKALNIVEAIKTAFEDDDRFENKPKIRIALHLAEPQKMNERYLQFSEGEKRMSIFKDIAGEPVINTARIEPVVKPNYVFASKEFTEDLSETVGLGHESLGVYELGKSHDIFEVELCSVFWESDKPDTAMLQAHLADKLDKRDDTYQNTSSMTNRFLGMPKMMQEMHEHHKTKRKRLKFFEKLNEWKNKY